MFGLIGKLVEAVIEGDLKAIVEVASDELVELGKEKIAEALDATGVGDALFVQRRFKEFIETQGRSELDELRKDFLRELHITPHLPGERFLNGLLTKGPESTQRRMPRWQRGGWAKSRQEWLDQGWRHDWRSQPRDWRGRWMAGRLPYPLVTTLKLSRRLRRLRRIKRGYRKAGRSMARGIVSSWSHDGN